MKLSAETLDVLKNFGNINSGIFFKKGKVLKTVSPHKNILAQASITDDIPSEFGIYDLNEFLSAVSMYKDDLDLQFVSNDIVITGLKGRSKMKYRSCLPSLLVTPPENELKMPDPEIKFELSADEFKWIMNSANILGSPQISVQSDGESVTINTLDLANDSSHTQTLNLDVETAGKKYKMLFKTENIAKLLQGSYIVEISSKGISHFKNKDHPVEYWISTESGSTFETV
jgi:hypothetical protein